MGFAGVDASQSTQTANDLWRAYVIYWFHLVDVFADVVPGLMVSAKFNMNRYISAVIRGRSARAYVSAVAARHRARSAIGVTIATRLIPVPSQEVDEARIAA